MVDRATRSAWIKLTWLDQKRTYFFSNLLIEIHVKEGFSFGETTLGLSVVYLGNPTFALSNLYPLFLSFRALSHRKFDETHSVFIPFQWYIELISSVDKNKFLPYSLTDTAPVSWISSFDSVLLRCGLVFSAVLDELNLTLSYIL